MFSMLLRTMDKKQGNNLEMLSTYSCCLLTTTISKENHICMTLYVEEAKDGSETTGSRGILP